MNYRKVTATVLFVLIFVILFCTAAFSQTSGITVSGGSQISVDNAKNSHNESFLAINPKDANHWLATAIVFENGWLSSYVYVSWDGGHTWKRGQMKSKGGERIFKGGEDPIVYFDPDGKTAFFGTIDVAPRNFLVSRSIDGGLTWEDPVTIPGGTFDRPYLGFDNSGGKFNHWIYAGGGVFTYDANGKRHYTISIVSSDDGGRTFSSGGLLDLIQGDEEIWNIDDLLVTSDGKLVIPFVTMGRTTSPDKNAPSVPPGYLWTAISEDGGLSFLPAVKGPSRSSAPSLFQLRASEGAARAAIDATKGHKDRICVTWADYDGKKYAVKEAYSKDLGKTWSNPVIVNDNTNEGEPANPAIAVNKDGTVAVIFNDRRDDPTSSCYQLYIAVSLDGGESFLPNVKASEKPTCPDAPGNWEAIYAGSFLDPLAPTDKKRPIIALGSAFPGNASGGDTQGLAADANGVFDVAWINGETGVMQLWSKSFTVDRTVLKSAIPKSRKDLSRDLTLDVSEPIVDFEKHLVTVKVRLENPTSAPIEGPFTVALDDNAESFLKDLHVVDADNHLRGKGAMWNFTTGGQKTLAPKQKSDIREFRWAFSDAPPERPASLGLLTARFRILGPVQQ